MADPGRYKWIWFQVTPKEAEGDRFYLDDIVLCDQDDKYHLYQIKHRQHPARDNWKWDHLLKPQRGSKASLIEKWFRSYFQGNLQDKIGYAAFLTNGFPAGEVAGCIFDNKIDIKKVKASSPDIYRAIKEKLGNEDRMNSFFTNFRFEFGQKDDAELENETREFLYQELLATKEGVNNLILNIKRECREEHTRPVTLDELKEWCEFDDPRPLNEHFEVPEDFEFFDSDQHERILADLQNPNGGIKVFHGKPGSGKSTYLAKLHKILEKNGIISIRHHYHISLDDPDSLERLQTERVVEAMRAEFKKHPEELGNLAHKNFENTSLRELINQVAQSLYKHSKSFVVIIDGLDHVLRYAEAKELEDFLREVCFPQNGLWLIFGTQESAKDCLPQIVFDKCTEDGYIEVKGVNRQASDRIIARNLISLNLPIAQDQFQELGERFFNLTQGNPLHLRYTLRQLKHCLGEQCITVYDLNNLVAYGGDIARYYDSLWRKLPRLGQSMALTVASVSFKFKKEQLFDLIASFEGNPAKVSEAFGSILHLLSEDRRGLSVYHSSFEAFILGRSEFAQQEKSIKGSIKQWLESSNYEELKWAELKRLAYDLGDPKGIMSLDRNWLIESICCARESRQIVSQLRLAAKAAFEERRFGKAFNLAGLNTYYQNAIQFVEDANEKIWKEAFVTRNRSPLSQDFTVLSSEQIRIVVQEAEKRGHYEVIIDEVMDVLNERHKQMSEGKKGEIGAKSPSSAFCLIDIISLDGSHNVEGMHRYIKQFGELGWAEDLFASYVSCLLQSDQIANAQRLLELELSSNERLSILSKCAEYDLRSKGRYFLEMMDRADRESLDYFCLLYLLLQNRQIGSIPPLPPYREFPVSVPRHETRKRSEYAALFSKVFILGIIYGLTGREHKVREWIDGTEKRWALQVASQLLLSATRVAQELKKGQAINCSSVFESVGSIPPLRWPEDGDVYELQISLNYALSDILELIYLLRSHVERSIAMEADEMRFITSTPYYRRENLLSFLLKQQTPLLSREAYSTYVQEERRELQESVSELPSRAEHYAELAHLARIYQDEEAQQQLIRLAASNLLGYGAHKDMYLYNVLQSIQACHQAGSKKADEWIERLAPIIENVTRYTDGDETSYFSRHLAESLVIVNPGVLRRYYHQKTKDEELFLAQDTFRYVLRSMQFKEDVDIGLATTALDQSSLKELKDISQSKSGACKALEIIEEYFGRIEYQEEDTPSVPEPSGKITEDYSSIEPKALEQRLTTFKSRWDRNEFLTKWIKYWLKRNNIDKKGLYKLLTSVIERDDLHNAGRGILDFLYPLVYEFNNDKAFEYLCWSQANDSGWSPDWIVDKKGAEKRWLLVKENHSVRYMEFFEKSVTRSRRWYREEETYTIPIPRAVEFFAQFGHVEKMEEITESAVSFAECLMADLSLPACRWISSPTVDEFDVLLQRLVWPGPLVRERAATAIGSLLKYSTNKGQIFKRLLAWIQEQRLESVVAVGLLPLLKAAEKVDVSLSHISLQEVIRIIPMTSVVIEKLVDDLTRLLNEEVTLASNRRKITKVPSGYFPSDFFSKYIKAFLAPIYSQRAEEMGKSVGGDFLKQWAHTSEEIMKECGICENVGNARDFMGGHYRSTLPGMSTLLSEVYRSAFLRVLQHFHDQRLVPDDFYFEYAYATLPVDLSYWKVKPSRAPGWWPQLKYRTPGAKEGEELLKIDYQESVEQITRNSRKSTILGIDGAIRPAEGWATKTLNASLILIAFGYKVVGPDMPQAREVADEILYSPSTFVLPSRADLPFNFLESYTKHLATQGSPIELGDLIVYPLVSRARDMVIGLWQWFRDHSSFLLLHNELTRGLKIELRDNGWDYMKDARKLGRCSDWLEGLKVRDDDFVIPHGCFVEAGSSFVKSYLKQNGLRLGYVLKTTYRYRKHSYEDIKTIDDYQLLNVSRLII